MAKKPERNIPDLTPDAEEVESKPAAIKEEMPKEKKTTPLFWTKFNTKRAKDSAKIRAGYRERAIGFVRPISVTMNDDARIKGVDSAYNYLLEVSGRPPMNFMVYMAVTLIVGILIGAFTVSI
jgi:hypothetical protein